jgi:transmembrane sensor
MNASPSVSDLEAIACDWLAKRDRVLTPEESAELQRWLEDPAHAAAFTGCEQTWSKLLLATNRATQMRIESMLKPRARRKMAPLLWIGSAVTAAAAVVTLMLVRPTDATAGNPKPLIETYAAPAGHESRVALPDGSVAVLRRGSRIAYGNFPSGRRIRLLEGEVHFTVSKTQAKPFYVYVGPVVVRDIGTAFNVKLETERVAVLVTQGSVAVSDRLLDGSALPAGVPSQAPELILTQGQETVIETGVEAIPEVRVPASSEIAQAMAWRSHRITYERTTLETAVAELNRYNVRQLSIGDSSISGMLIGGSIQSDDLEAFIGLLETAFNVSADRRGDEYVLRKKR